MCKKFICDGYPIATVQYFHGPQMKSLELRSHDRREQKVYQQLHHLCKLDGTISNLTRLHLALESSERPISRVSKYLGGLQKLCYDLHIYCLWTK